MLRVTLTNIKEQFTIEKNDPVGINELVLQIKRSYKNDGIFFEIIAGLKFIKEAIPFLQNSFKNYGGLDAVVLVTVYEYDPNSRIWEVYQEGKVNFNKKVKSNDYFETVIEQVGQQTAILNAFDTDTDLNSQFSFDGSFDISAGYGGIINTTLHSKGVLTKNISAYNFDAPLELLPLTATKKYYALYDSITSIDEILDVFNYPNQINSVSPVDQLKYKLKAKYAGTYTFIFKDRTTYTSDGGPGWQIGNTIRYILVYGKPSAYTTVILNSYVVAGVVPDDLELSFDSTQVITLTANDEVYFYTDFDVSTNSYFIVYPFLLSNHSEYCILEIQALTFYPVSACPSFLLFETVDRMLKYHSNGKVSLRSNLLGRTDLGYASDGEASLIVWTNGANIRQLADKKIFANLGQVMKFINAAFCASYGFEFEDNQWYLRVEKRNYFFDNATQVVKLSGQYDFEERLNDKMYYKQVIYGYNNKIDLKQVNAIDDFNTLRKITSPVVNSKNTFDITSNVRANGSEIEYQRRLIGLSEDSKLDDQNFVVVVVRDGANYKSKKMEGYSAVTGVYDAPTGYNYDISPARMLKNWYAYLSANVVYSSSKVFIFSSGENNYAASTTKTGEVALFENGNVDLTLEVPLFELLNYILIDVVMTRSQLALLKVNPFGYLTFADNKNVLYHGFIDSNGIEHDSNKGLASVQLLKAFKVL